MNTNPSINPFFAARTKRFTAMPMHTSPKAVYAKLPLAPVNTSPVPHLTSLYHNARAGDYGSRAYPGNCGGNLIKDLLRYFNPGIVCDPMAGSGTCRDVCLELGIPCFSWDIHEGFDACDPNEFAMREVFDFIWRIRRIGVRNYTSTTPATSRVLPRSTTSFVAMVSSSVTPPRP